MADITPPVIENASPADGESNVGLSAPLEFDVVDVAEAGASGQVDVTPSDFFFLETIAADDVTDLWVMANPVQLGTVEVYRDGVLQNEGGSYTITVPDPEAGEILIQPAPDAGHVWLIRYMQAWVLNTVDFETIVVKVDGVPIFQNGSFSVGWDGTLEPIQRGYRFNITTHPPWASPPTPTTIIVEASDRLGNFATLSWSFQTTILSTDTVEDEGGALVEVYGSFAQIPHSIVVKVGLVEHPCYSGMSGEAYAPLPKNLGTTLRLVVPPLARGGPYDVIVRDGVNEYTFTGALTVVARNWREQTFSLRKAFPPWYKTGPRNVDFLALLV